MKECSKSIHRRLSDSRFITKYFVGSGIDIGGSPDPLLLYKELFPLVTEIRTWDKEDGDAQYMSSVPDSSVDFIHSSHCLEHLNDPFEGIGNWIRAVKPGGYVVVLVPDEDLYEQGEFPSTFNSDHKWTFTILKKKSWSKKSINLLDMLMKLDFDFGIEKIELLNATFRGGLPRYDQTKTPIGECCIEFVLKKLTSQEVEYGGQKPGDTQPVDEVRIHLNQYAIDAQTLRKENITLPPFQCKDPI